MPGTLFSVYNDALQMLGEAPLVTIVDDVPARYELDRALDGAATFMLRQAAWRFALSSVTLTGATGAPASPGYTYHLTLPGDWVYTHSIFVLQDLSREVPIDVREERGALFSNKQSVTMKTGFVRYQLKVIVCRTDYVCSWRGHAFSAL